MKSIYSGKYVTVNKHIFRVSHYVSEKHPVYNYTVNVPVIHLYAKRGEEGTVIECFCNRSGWFAKVLINHNIKTFRLTSLDVDMPLKSKDKKKNLPHRKKYINKRTNDLYHK